MPYRTSTNVRPTLRECRGVRIASRGLLGRAVLLIVVAGSCSGGAAWAQPPAGPRPSQRERPDLLDFDDGWMWGRGGGLPPGRGGRGGTDSVVDAHWLAPVSGLWSDASQWSSNPFAPNNDNPAGTSYNAYIDATGAAYFVSLSSAVSVNSLTVNSATATLGQSGALTVGDFELTAGQYNLSSATLSGGTLNIQSAGHMSVSSGTLDGIAINGGFSADGICSIMNGASFTGDAVLSTSGFMRFASGSTMPSGAIVFPATGSDSVFATGSANPSMTIGAGATIRGVTGRIGDRNSGNPGVDTIVNQGLISANGSSSSGIIVNPDVLTNTGHMESLNGDVLQIGYPPTNNLFNPPTTWTNTGVIEATSGDVYLGGHVRASDIGVIHRGAGRTVLLFGDVDGANQTLAISPQCDISYINGAYHGGQITVAPGLSPYLAGTFDQGVQISGTAIAEGFSFSGGLGVTGTIDVQYYMRAIGNQTISGPGTLSLSGGSVKTYAGETLTFAQGLAVRGRGSIGDNDTSSGQNTILSYGLISADQPSQTLLVSSRNFTNFGTIEAVNGATLTFGSTNQVWVNSGVVHVASGGIAQLTNTFSVAGGSFQNDGGTIDIWGTLENTGSSFTIGDGGDITLSRGLIHGGTVNVVGPGHLIDSGTGGGFGRLSGITLNGDIEARSRELEILNGITLNGVIRATGATTSVAFDSPTNLLDGSGSILLAGTSSSSPQRINTGVNSSLTIAPGILIHGGFGSIGDTTNIGGVNTVVNQGRISADVSAQSIQIASINFSNSGTVEAVNGGLLDIATPVNYVNNAPVLSWSSSGVLHAGAGSTIQLGGVFQTSSLQGLDASQGIVRLTGKLINTGSTLTLDGTANSWQLGSGYASGGRFVGAEIIGGTVNLLNGAGLNAAAGITGVALTNVTVNGDLTTNGSIFVNNSVLNGTTTIASGGQLVFGPPGASAGPITLPSANIVFSGGSLTSVGTVACDDLTLGAGVLARGGQGFFTRRSSTTQGSLVNNGTISADVNNQVISISPTFVNNGVCQALNGGILGLTGQWRNNGLIRSVGSSLQLAGIYAASGLGTLDISGSAVSLSGLFDNNNNTFNLTAGNTWTCNGATIKGGTLNMDPGVPLTLGNGGATLENLNVLGDIIVPGAASQVNVRNNLTQTGTIDLAGAGCKLTFFYDSAYPTGTIWFDPASGGNNRILTGGAGSSITLGPGAIVHGGRGTIATNSSITVVNQGLISADMNGLTIEIDTFRFQNQGTIQAINGGIIDFEPPPGGGGGMVLLNSGVLRPQAGRIFSIPGAYSQSDTGRLELLLDPRGGFAQLSVAGEADLAGTLALSFPAGFVPVPGETWRVLDLGSTSVNGWFDQLQFPSLPAGLSWDASLLQTEGSVRIVPAPGSVALAMGGIGLVARRRRAPVTKEVRP
jgi:hypothetical protein